MNDFALFEQLCVAESITSQYKYGERVSERINILEDLIKSRKYCIAVIGEFKRGKSSLINALIGSRILPTDILPMTASITHIRYGEEKKIQIIYKDGTSETKSIEELVDYATKFDAEKEKTAERINEILVRYPSVLCKNNIEVFDTPGLNDDEKMSNITLDILGDIDAAVMVVSACLPMSLTEQNLILRLIEEPGIRHIIFVVTYIDAVSDEVEEQDRMIDGIEKRITDKILPLAEEKFSSDELLMKKAKRILSSPHIYGVSSTLAMDGFITDSKKKLKQSRLPVFKQELLDYLVSAQTIDAKDRVTELLNEIKENIASWCKAETDELKSEKERLLKTRREYEYYFDYSEKKVNRLLGTIDESLASVGLTDSGGNGYAAMQKAIRRIFINNLFQIREKSYTEENLRNVLNASFDKADELNRDFNDLVYEATEEILNSICSDYLKLRPKFPEFPSEEHTINSYKDLFEHKIINEKPTVIKLERTILSSEKLVGINVIDSINRSLTKSINNFNSEFSAFLNSWKTFINQCHKTLIDKKEVLEFIDKKVSSIDVKLNALEYGINSDINRLNNAISIVEECD
ncbi:MAG: hypothetical protein E7570_07730 [Ruminococcaceae bacterium]|nr:hypothetical protein [Oscillospiraceae bacterium]